MACQSRSGGYRDSSAHHGGLTDAAAPRARADQQTRDPDAHDCRRLTKRPLQPAPEPTRTRILEDDDAQLALWVLYELHYRDFDGVPADMEWDAGLVALRRSLELRFERELREAVEPALKELRG